MNHISEPYSGQAARHISSGPHPNLQNHERIRIGIAMTYLANFLGTNLMGVVSGHSAAELARMNLALRNSQAVKARNTGR